jgi:hypothetical protein
MSHEATHIVAHSKNTMMTVVYLSAGKLTTTGLLTPGRTRWM